jgi:hypothetical protein
MGCAVGVSGDNLGWLEGSSSVEQSSRVNEYLTTVTETPGFAGWTDAVANAFRVDSEASAY